MRLLPLGAALLVWGCGPAPATGHSHDYDTGPALLHVHDYENPDGTWHHDHLPIYDSTPPTTRVASFKQDVVPILRTHCAECHTVGKAAGAHLPMFGRDGEPFHAGVVAHASVLVPSIETGDMPEGRPGSVPPEEVELLRAWVRSGVPNN